MKTITIFLFIAVLAAVGYATAFLSRQLATVIFFIVVLLLFILIAGMLATGLEKFDMWRWNNFRRKSKAKDIDDFRLRHAAAAQGDAKAQHNLGCMYYSGYGVTKDVHEAYIWLLIANASEFEELGERLSAMSKQLSSAEKQSAVSEANRRLQEIYSKHKDKCVLDAEREAQKAMQKAMQKQREAEEAKQKWCEEQDAMQEWREADDARKRRGGRIRANALAGRGNGNKAQEKNKDVYENDGNDNLRLIAFGIFLLVLVILAWR